MGYRDQVDSGTAKPSVREMVDQNSVSWNLTACWLSQIASLQQ